MSIRILSRLESDSASKKRILPVSVIICPHCLASSAMSGFARDGQYQTKDQYLEAAEDTQQKTKDAIARIQGQTAETEQVGDATL